jgi:hypothetical protein
MNQTSTPNTAPTALDATSAPVDTELTQAEPSQSETITQTRPLKTNWSFPEMVISQTPGGDSPAVADQHLNIGGKILIAGAVGVLGYAAYRLFGKDE